MKPALSTFATFLHSKQTRKLCTALRMYTLTVCPVPHRRSVPPQCGSTAWQMQRSPWGLPCRLDAMTSLLLCARNFLAFLSTCGRICLHVLRSHVRGVTVTCAVVLRYADWRLERSAHAECHKLSVSSTWWDRIVHIKTSKMILILKFDRISTYSYNSRFPASHVCVHTVSARTSAMEIAGT